MIDIDASKFVAVQPGFYAPASAKSIRQRIHEFEDQLRAHTEPVEFPPIEQFCDGVYMRTIFIPAGVALTGLVHRFDCLNIVHGDITVASEEGRKRVTALGAPVRFHSKAGIKRAGAAHADTWWTTVHANPNNERDPEKIKAMLAFDDRAMIDNEVMS